MTEEQQKIAEKIIRFLILQSGDCRPKDYVDDENLITDLLDEYVSLERPSQDAK